MSNMNTGFTIYNVMFHTFLLNCVIINKLYIIEWEIVARI